MCKDSDLKDISKKLQIKSKTENSSSSSTSPSSSDDDEKLKDIRSKNIIEGTKNKKSK
jgi:hypothetical protein